MTEEDQRKLAAAGIMYPPNTAEEYSAQLEERARAEVMAARESKVSTWPPPGSLDLFCPKPKPPAPEPPPFVDHPVTLKAARAQIINVVTGKAGVTRARLYQMIERGQLPRRLDNLTGLLFLLQSDVDLFNTLARRNGPPTRKELRSKATTCKKSAA